MKSIIVMLVAGVACLSVFGCGGSSDTPTAASYKAEVNAICKQGVGEWQSLFQKVTKEHKSAKLSPAESTKIFAQDILLPPLEKMVAEFSKLEPPAEGAKQVESVIGEFKTVLVKGKANYAELQSGERLSAARKNAEAAGLKDCAP